MWPKTSSRSGSSRSRRIYNYQECHVWRKSASARVYNYCCKKRINRKNDCAKINCSNCLVIMFFFYVVFSLAGRQWNGSCRFYFNVDSVWWWLCSVCFKVPSVISFSAWRRTYLETTWNISKSPTCTVNCLNRCFQFRFTIIDGIISTDCRNIRNEFWIFHVQDIMSVYI